MAAGFDVSSMIQNTNADGTCACDFEKVHLSCARNKVEVFETLPDSGESGTTYLVGNNETGYTEYVWDTRIGFVNMGTANSSRHVATADTLGFVRLSTGVTLNDSNAGLIGLNSRLQLMAQNATNNRYGTIKLSADSVIDTVADNPEYRGGAIGADANGRIYGVTATRERYGMVKLGSIYAANNAYGYVVGVGSSTSPGREGQLMFNLQEQQSDGSPGCLRNEEVRDANNRIIRYELRIEEGTDEQMGIVKLCHALPTSITDSSFPGTLEEFQDEYMRTRRYSHAASVGLVMDHLDAFLEWYFTDYRIGEFFSRWAGSRALGDEIWANEDYRGVLLDTIVGNAAVNESLQGWAEGSAERYAEDWLTNEKAHELFDALVVNAAKDEARVYWTDEINGVITREVEREVSEQTGVYITQWMKDASNVENLAGVVVQSVLGDLEDKAAETAGDYMDKVFNGEEEISINGEKQNFAAWAEAKIQALVNNQTSGIENSVRAIDQKFDAYVKNPFEGLAQITVYTNDTAGADFPVLNHNFSQYRYVEVVFGYQWEGDAEASTGSVLIDMREVAGWYKLSGRPLYYGASRSYHNKSPDSNIGVCVTPYWIRKAHQNNNYSYEWVKGVYGYAEA